MAQKPRLSSAHQPRTTTSSSTPADRYPYSQQTSSGCAPLEWHRNMVIAGDTHPLACACWRLATRLRKPTGHVVGQIVRVVKGAIQQCQRGEPAEPKHPRRRTYLSSINRMSAANSVSAQIIILHVN